MKRIKHAIAKLEQDGIKIDSITRLNEGGNSEVFRIERGSQRYFLKLFKLPTDSDKRQRLKAEYEFIQHVQLAAWRYIPTILNHDETYHWALFEWVDGTKPKQLNDRILHEFIAFVKKINKSETRNKALKTMQEASEACSSHDAFKHNINYRLTELAERLKLLDFDKKTKKWISETVIPEGYNRLNIFEKVSCESQWKDLRMIASPSDVGIHNTIQTKDNYYFIDFEYAGLDDPAKLACDFILQPNHQTSERHEQLFLKLLNDAMNKIDQNSRWLDRYENIKPLIHIKWTLIMLNRLNNEKSSKNKIKEIREYYNLCH